MNENQMNGVSSEEIQPEETSTEKIQAENIQAENIQAEETLTENIQGEETQAEETQGEETLTENIQGEETLKEETRPGENTPEKKDKKKKTVLWIVLGVIAAALAVYFLCFYKSPAVRTAEERITAIGTVSLSSEANIQAAESAVSLLSDRERSQVENIEALARARSQYDDLLNHKKAEDTDKLIEKIGIVDSASGKKIEKARNAYDALTEPQKQYVEKLDVLEAAEEEYSLLDVREVEQMIADIEKAADDPEYSLPLALSLARAAYDELAPERQSLVSNYQNLEAAETAYEEYAVKEAEAQIAKEKKQRLDERTSFMNSCQEVTYAQLLQHPDDFRGKQVKLTVKLSEIEDPALFKSGKMVGVIPGDSSKNLISIVDKRSVKEPKLTEGSVITVYGTAQGITTLEKYEEGSGLFGSNLFAKLAESKELPVVHMTFTDVDTIEAINAQPTVTEVISGVEKGIEIAQDITNVIKSIPWDKFK